LQTCFRSVVKTNSGEEMKYKIGDVVKVRKDLKAGKTYGKDVAVSPMMKFRGRAVTISSKANGTYHVKEDKDKWYWTDEMLRGKAKKPKKVKK